MICNIKYQIQKSVTYESINFTNTMKLMSLLCQGRVCYVLILSFANSFWQILFYAPYMNNKMCNNNVA